MILRAFLQFLAAAMTVLVVAIIGGLLGGKEIFKMLVIVSLGIGILAGLETIFQYIKIYRQDQHLPNPVTIWLDEDYIEIVPNIIRSSDGSHQLRMTRADGPEHYHAEVIDPESFIVLESNVCGEIKSKFPRMDESRWAVVVNIPEVDLVVKHYLGYPPELTNEPDSRTLLSLPKVLVIKQTAASDVFLFRFTETGEYAGDTWHQSIEEAKKQADFEYGVAKDSWQRIPSEVKDVVRFTLNL